MAGRLGGRFDLSQYSVQVPRAGRYSASAVYSEIRFNGQLSRAMTENVSAEFVRFGRVGFHDQVQLKTSHNYGLDWSHEFGLKRPYVLVGLERQTAPARRLSISPVAALRVPLPHGQGLTLSYMSVRGSRFSCSSRSGDRLSGGGNWWAR